VVAEILTGVFTFDHRFGDAAVAGNMLKVTADYISDPENFNPAKHKDIITVDEKEL